MIGTLPALTERFACVDAGAFLGYFVFKAKCTKVFIERVSVMRNTLVKVVAVVAEKGEAGWPCVDWPYEKELNRIMSVVREMNADMTFDVVSYSTPEQAKADYEADLKKYDGVLVLEMTCWKYVEQFYMEQAAEGLPTIVADVLFYGSGSTLAVASQLIRNQKLPVPLISTADYREIGQAVRCFDAIRRMKEARILVVGNKDYRVEEEGQERFEKLWGCTFINCKGAELNQYFAQASDEEAQTIAQQWMDEADNVYEPTREEIVRSAKLHIAIRNMMKAHDCNAVTLDCLNLSYENQYMDNKHMYPCLSHYEMLRKGTVAVCEADAYSTVSSLLIQFMTGRPGFVSDPAIDTSSDQITYAHCVACTKVFGIHDARTCRYNIRSHAEDRRGASVQVIFPAGEKLTTIQSFPDKTASIHSSVSVGNCSLEEGCRSKLVASANAEKLLEQWSPSWHHVTVFGDYRKVFGYLFKMKGIQILEEDK